MANRSGEIRTRTGRILSPLSLPLDYAPSVPPLGFEPRTYGLKDRYSNQLSYEGMVGFLDK